MDAAERERYGPQTRPLPYERGTDGPRVVLVGVDGSRTSMRAAAYAAGLARRQGATLVAVFVSSPASYSAMLSGVVAGAVQQTHDELADELRAECRRGAEELDLPVTFLCRRGDAYTELCRAADEHRADMVVVGSSEQAGHRLVGSVATRLVRTGRWPVVVVP
ncbi:MULTISPECIES: universal stress protein [Micromonospora]|uniref:universal stress protein n=1 Tax=Micromonospora TaxID=1873 RepID=UPI00188E513B|nr:MULTISPECIES: universal stress protein [unclassified Micromonospora]MBF5029571.1 universal stress protein [Micromonospora sp. ANENR4]MCZ7473729.1 universal stress protein [Micromonospora sp. WMMC273]WBC04403.1 universal stress protein [Micromonospora sp. WMMA1976]